MIVVGITGSTGTGKSTVMGILAARGIPTCSADALVHEILENDPDVCRAILEKFPFAEDSGKISRRQLAVVLDQEEAALDVLESILHPVVLRQFKSFLAEHRQKHVSLVALEIPLLYETGYHKTIVHKVIVTHAPFVVQEGRVLQREGMTLARFSRVLERQLPQGDKVPLADYVVHTDTSLEKTTQQVLDVLKDIEQKISEGDHA